MTESSHTFEVYLEIGTKRTFAGAIAWPGWCRSGRDEAAALAALCATGPRYAALLRRTGLGFHAPADVAAFQVIERLDGNTTTDFGAPDAIPAGDTEPLDAAAVQRFETVLRACWRAFDAAAADPGRELRKGPRGGGRTIEGVIQHVLGADRGYLSAAGWKLESRKDEDSPAALERTRQAILAALTAAAHGQIAERGSRGGRRWPARYFVRRVAWHVLDHAWEIEDRLL
jgi:hypothetical protein